METYRVIGLMSGTSLDGLDMAYCVFTYKNKKWSFTVKNAVTLKYGNTWQKKLEGAHHLSAPELLKLHNEYGDFSGNRVAEFVKKHGIKKVDFIASHGHTVFHRPDKHFTFQLGHGASVAARCDLPVISDFRSLDVAMGGHGAPLVPIGDMLLFPEYDFCLNLGGFANISYSYKGKRVAFDICPANIILNYLARNINKEFDKDGTMASKGKISKPVLKKLNRLDYYKQRFPKSLGREWLEEKFMPVTNRWHAPIEDKLATVTEHVATQVTMAIAAKGKTLVTGGGAHNKYLIERIKRLAPAARLVIPHKELVNYKEALVFAFLGVLRYRGEANCLGSVTGASKNNPGGAIYLPAS